MHSQLEIFPSAGSHFSFICSDLLFLSIKKTFYSVISDRSEDESANEYESCSPMPDHEFEPGQEVETEQDQEQEHELELVEHEQQEHDLELEQDEEQDLEQYQELEQEEPEPDEILEEEGESNSAWAEVIRFV